MSNTHSNNSDLPLPYVRNEEKTENTIPGMIKVELPGWGILRVSARKVQEHYSIALDQRTDHQLESEIQKQKDKKQNAHTDIVIVSCPVLFDCGLEEPDDEEAL